LDFLRAGFRAARNSAINPTGFEVLCLAFGTFISFLFCFTASLSSVRNNPQSHGCWRPLTPELSGGGPLGNESTEA